MLVSAVLATLVASVAAKEGRTFAVLRFKGNGPLVEGRSDPIVTPGGPSSHVHTVMGGNGFSNSATGQSMMASTCSNANIKGDKSAYWMPKLYFHDEKKNTFEPVELFYMNVYYFFEGTNDKIVAFPVGLSMVSGSAGMKAPPASRGEQILDPSKGAPQPAQWTCPRSNFVPPSWPANSDGSKGGFQDANNKGSGVGFPFAECDGYASPLRADLHFPSCYDPSKALTDYKNNMKWPTSTSNGKHDCPPGFMHVPHLFFEMYWNTPKFKDRWTPNKGSQPFVLSNGDAAGYSLHGDFLAGWDTKLLQHIIDTCDAGSKGMDNCQGVTLNPEGEKCHINNPTPENIGGVLTSLPGTNPLFGWKYGSGGAAPPGGSTPPPAGGDTPPAGGDNPPAGGDNPPAGGDNPPAGGDNPPAGGDNPPAGGDNPPAGGDNPPAGGDYPSQTTKAPVGGGYPAVTPIVSTSTDAYGNQHVTTIYETVTVEATTTVYGGGHPSAPTDYPTTPNTTSKGDAAGWKYAGCYRDTSARVIHGEKFPKLGGTTNEKCAAYCQTKGFCLSGTENSGQCFCGNEVVGSEKLDDSECAKPCDGDAADVCGGSWAVSVYSKDGSIGGAATKAKRSVHLHNHMLHHRAARRSTPGRV